MVNQNNTRQDNTGSNRLTVFHNPAETYIETDWFDSEATADYELPILHKRNEQRRKSFLERFGFGTYKEMLNCEKDGLR